MNLFLFLFVVQGIVAFGLVVVVLMQRSEGGGLGIGGGGSPGGLMSARGAADFLTRTTKWLAVMFVVLSIALAGLAIKTTSGHEIKDTLTQPTAPSGQNGLAPAQPASQQAPASSDQAPPAPSQVPANPDPLAGVTK